MHWTIPQDQRLKIIQSLFEFEWYTKIFVISEEIEMKHTTCVVSFLFTSPRCFTFFIRDILKNPKKYRNRTVSEHWARAWTTDCVRQTRDYQPPRRNVKCNERHLSMNNNQLRFWKKKNSKFFFLVSLIDQRPPRMYFCMEKNWF